MTTYKINLSTTEPNNDVGLIKIRQDDTMTQRLSVTVYEHDKLVDLTGYDIYLNSKMPNQSTVRDKVTDLINPKNGHFSYTLIDSFWQCLGDISLWFSFEINGTRDSTANFEYRVIQGHCKEINQGNYIWEFEELKRKLEEMGLDLSKNYEDFKQRLDVLLEMFKAMNTYSKEEIDHMLIKLLAGEKISATFTMDFKNKVAGSLVENPNVAKWVHHEDLLIPSNTAYKELSQAYYNQLNDDVFSVNATDTNKKAIMLSSFNISEDFKRKFQSLFNGLNVTQQVALVKKYITKSYPSIYAKGSNSAGNKATLNLYSPSENKYVVAATNNTDTIKKFGLSLSAYATSFYMDSTGNINMLLNAEPSDGKTASSLSIDYVSLDYTVELSLRDIFTTKEELEAVKVALEATKNELKKDIDDLKKYVNTELAKKQDTITDTGFLGITMQHGIGSGKISIRKRDKLVMFSGDSIVGDANLQKQVKIWDIPAQYKPNKVGFAYLFSPFTNEVVKLQYNATEIRVIGSSGNQDFIFSFNNLFWYTD